MAVGYQSFYQAQLTANISDTDLTIPLDIVPTPSEGFLVIESTVASKREIIYYTSKGASSVTCPANGRGYDGTTAVSHLQNAAVIMAPVGAMFTSLTDLFTTSPQGWTSLGINQSGTITYNGNRSYTIPFASTVASILSEGMRLEFTKTVAGNGYMGGAFNGSSHYFTKATPSGTLGTVTNNFTIEAVVQPTSYAAGMIAARADAAANNGLFMYMNASGQLVVGVRNAGVANYREISTYQSLPLNKKTHVAASWNGTGPSVTLYFDGVAVPGYQSGVGGTNPTTAGTGGDFSIGRLGANNAQYFPGYISNVAVFDAVLSAATIKQHATYKLLGSETNCIGAWSLDNTANDQSSAGNNLTATGGVGYTAMSPHGQLGNGVVTTKAVGLVMAVSTTDVTVQVPEGVTIPTTGGITSVAYSTQANPFGWTQKGLNILGVSETRASQTPITTTTDLLGATQTVTAPSGKMLRISLFAYGLQSSATGTATITILDGATVIYTDSNFIATATGAKPVALSYSFYPQSGARTYKVQVAVAGGGNGTWIATATGPTQFIVEAI